MENKHKGAEEAAKKVFSKGTDDDRVRISVQGGPALQLRLVLKTPLVKFFRLIEGDNPKSDQ